MCVIREHRGEGQLEADVSGPFPERATYLTKNKTLKAAPGNGDGGTEVAIFSRLPGLEHEVNRISRCEPV